MANHRRRFIGLSIASIAAINNKIDFAFCLSALAKSPAQQLKPEFEAIDSWMRKWKGDHRKASGLLKVARFADPMYVLLEPIQWNYTVGANISQKIIVPKGFVTDFASIPQIFWSLLRPDGQYAYAAVLHDYLYWSQIRTRQEADEIFKIVMEEFAVKDHIVQAIYSSVRNFGQNSWNKNADLKKAGEQRILKILPVDPTTTWESWKQKQDVFVIRND